MKKEIKKSCLLKKIIKLSFYKKKITFIVLFISFLITLSTFYRPKLIQNFIENLNFQEKAYLLPRIILFISISFLSESILQFLLNYLSNILSQNIINHLRLKLFNKLLHSKIYFFKKVPIGLIISRIISDMEKISIIFSDGILLLFGDTLKMISILIIMFLLNSRLSIISLAIPPIVYIITYFFQKALRKKFRDERLYNTNLNSFIQERINNMLIIKILNRKKIEYQNFKKKNYLLTRSYINTIFYFSMFFPIIELLSSISISSAIIYGSYRCINIGDVKPKDIVSFIFFIYIFFRPLSQIADRFNNMQIGFAGAERVFDLLDKKLDKKENGKLCFKKLSGHILFENVHFSYSNEVKILNGLSLEILPGEKVAIVGNTGAGKSTLVQLLGRFYDIDKGKIKIDGNSIKSFDLKNLRSNIRVMTQESFLFNNTIKKNMSMGKEYITIEKIKEKSKIIGINKFIESLPLGYNQNIEEKGRLFSSGQRQLLSFLRAQLHTYSIMVLDEATSSMDSHNENIMYNFINNLSHDKTFIIIAHKLSTIRKMDKIIVLDKGVLAEEGTHNELLLKKGIYWKMYNSKNFD